MVFDAARAALVVKSAEDDELIRMEIHSEKTQLRPQLLTRFEVYHRKIIILSNDAMTLGGSEQKCDDNQLPGQSRHCERPTMSDWCSGSRKIQLWHNEHNFLVRNTISKQIKGNLQYFFTQFFSVCPSLWLLL